MFCRVKITSNLRMSSTVTQNFFPHLSTERVNYTQLICSRNCVRKCQEIMCTCEILYFLPLMDFDDEYKVCIASNKYIFCVCKFVDRNVLFICLSWCVAVTNRLLLSFHITSKIFILFATCNIYYLYQWFTVGQGNIR